MKRHALIFCTAFGVTLLLIGHLQLRLANDRLQRQVQTYEERQLALISQLEATKTKVAEIDYWIKNGEGVGE